MRLGALDPGADRQKEISCVGGSGWSSNKISMRVHFSLVHQQGSLESRKYVKLVELHERKPKVVTKIRGGRRVREKPGLFLQQLGKE